MATVTLTTTLILFSFCFFSGTAAELETFYKSYETSTQFSEDRAKSELIFLNDADVDENALQLTPDSLNTAVRSLQNRFGRVMLRKRFKLWDDNDDVVASFNTSFLVNILPQSSNGTAGEGLAFLIAPTLEIPDNSHGQYLGLTNATTDGQVANGVVAVEFDTLKQDHDVDNNHVGLNVHTIRSIAVESLTPFNITLAPGPDPEFRNIWIQYDGVAKFIRVYVAAQLSQTSPTPAMPTDPILQSQLDLREAVHEDSYIGFSASTGDFTELNCVLRWNLTVNYFPRPESPWPKISLGVGVPALAFAAAIVGYCLYKKRLRDRSKTNIVRQLRTLPGTPREFSFGELKRATNNFEEKRKLGEGGYGVVYKGLLRAENVEVAVKWFSRGSLEGEGDFLAELTIINRLRHKHLVRLLGWCHKNGKLLLVYEYMPNGSLDMHLFTAKGVEPPQLSWSLRCKILTGVASALHYLHHEFDQRVVHRDIKASNIMLDSNFNARLGDFGLARALDNEKTSYAEALGVIGTIGYIAPECFLTGKATQQSDIYAFGALLIEVVTGQRPGTKVNGFELLVDYVWWLYREGRMLDAVDARLGGDYAAEEAERLLLLGLACSHPMATERPKTEAIMQMISGSVVVPLVPPFKPAFVWPAAAVPVADLSSATTAVSISGDDTVRNLAVSLESGFSR